MPAPMRPQSNAAHGRPKNLNGLKRIMAMIWKSYKWQLIIIAVLILCSSLVNVYGSTSRAAH